MLDSAGIPYLSGMRTSLAAIAQWLRAPERARPAVEKWGQAQYSAMPNIEPGPIFPQGEIDGFDLLRGAGVPMTGACAVKSPVEAVSAARAFGYPVVMKGCAPGLPHKSELGLVRVGLADDASVHAAFEDLASRLANALPANASREIVVQAMAAEGIELIVAVRNDPHLGSFVVVGPGGLLVEVMGKVSIRRGPVDVETAHVMLDETAAGTLLGGVRGRGPFDRNAAAEAIAALSRIGATLHGTAATIEINPLIVTARGAFGVDLLIELQASN